MRFVCCKLLLKALQNASNIMLKSERSERKYTSIGWIQDDAAMLVLYDYADGGKSHCRCGRHVSELQKSHMKKEVFNQAYDVVDVAAQYGEAEVALSYTQGQGNDIAFRKRPSVKSIS